MFAVILLAVITCVSAAPYCEHYYHHHPSYPQFDNKDWEHFMHRKIFDTKRFWQELAQKVPFLDSSKHFHSGTSDTKVEGNEYTIRIALPNFREDEITVTVTKRLLIIRAVSKMNDYSVFNYLDTRTLPDYVKGNGKWTFVNGILTIVFPLVDNSNGTETTEATTTQDREVVENNTTDDSIVNVDVGADRGDIGSETDLLTNEVSKKGVETNNHGVDLQDNVNQPINY